MQLDLVTNEINLVLEELLNFIQTEDAIKTDFNDYIKTMGGREYYKNKFAEIAVPYIFERKLPNTEKSVIQFYLQKHKKLPEEAKNLLNALQNSVCSIFEIKKNIKNGFELYNLVNEKTYETIYPFKMTNLRGVGAGQFLVARLFYFENTYYAIEISGILPSTKRTDALQYAVAKIIQEPHLVYIGNPQKQKEIEKSVKTMYAKFIEAFGTDKLFTTSTYSDDIMSMFNEYAENGTPVDLYGKLQELDEYKYFDVKDYNTNYNTFIKNSVTGYFNKKELYDVAIIFDKEEGLYVVPFYKSFERILTSDDFDKIENYEKCVNYFLTTQSISANILKGIYEQYPRFLDIVNYVIKDNLTFNEIIERYKKTDFKTFSHTTILYNSEVFSTTLTNIVDTKKREEVNYRGIKRNDLCPCGSGKKYKNCCLI